MIVSPRFRPSITEPCAGVKKTAADYDITKINNNNAILFRFIDSPRCTNGEKYCNTQFYARVFLFSHCYLRNNKNSVYWRGKKTSLPRSKVFCDSATGRPRTRVALRRWKGRGKKKKQFIFSFSPYYYFTKNATFYFHRCYINIYSAHNRFTITNSPCSITRIMCI